MKYVLLFCGTEKDAAEFAALSPDELWARYAQVGAWFAVEAGQLSTVSTFCGTPPGQVTVTRYSVAWPWLTSTLNRTHAV